MLFNSYTFIFGYLPVVWAGFFYIARDSHRLAALWLAVASLFFYGWWNPTFVLLVITSIAANYAFGYSIGHVRLISTTRAKYVLTVAVALNLGALAYYKYVNFLIANARQLTGMELAMFDVVLPLGISFFTFTQIAFLVDVYRGVAREYNFIHYVLFVTYFPHLIAGPVLHHKQMMPQFGQHETYRVSMENICIGLTVFTIGLAKKVLLADEFALYANPVFGTVEQGGTPKLFEAWGGTIAYALQLYFDFSGYSDMAIGLSRMFNVKLPLNFDSPYKSRNIIEFWRRWHITLSYFLRDYLYIPLGGKQKGILRRYTNLMLTMLLGGLWHGAGWTFVLWGGVHGAYLAINHGWHSLTGRLNNQRFGLSRVATTVFTFLAVVVAWVPFRAANMDVAVKMWSGMFGANGVSLPQLLESRLPIWLGDMVAYNGLAPMATLNVKEMVIALSFGLAVVWLLPNTQQFVAKIEEGRDRSQSSLKFNWLSNSNASRYLGLFMGMLFIVSLAHFNKFSPFLYFQF